MSKSATEDSLAISVDELHRINCRALEWLVEKYRVPPVSLLTVPEINEEGLGGCIGGYFFKDPSKVNAEGSEAQDTLRRAGIRPLIVVSHAFAIRSPGRYYHPILPLFHEFHHYLEYLNNRRSNETTIDNLATEDLEEWLD